MKKWAEKLERAVLGVLLHLTPPRPHMVVHGYPVSEGNAVEMLRVCSQRYEGRIYWLVSDRASARKLLQDTEIESHRKVNLVDHRSFMGMWRYVTAELVMFTHGLYRNPRRKAGKTVVNLWHGDGFKALASVGQEGHPFVSSDFLVTSSALFSQPRMVEGRIPANGLLLTGNPRTDQFHTKQNHDLAPLGVDSNRPFVLWMPTFRRAKQVGLASAWDDAPGVVDSRSKAIFDVVRRGVEVLSGEYNLTVVIKPHPLDVDNRNIPGAVVVTNEILQTSGVQLYELIGASAGLLTDYSSVWTDYLSLDRPIGFIVPDEAEYAAGRGIVPEDALEWLPGNRIKTIEHYREFAKDILSGGQLSASQRAKVADHIGYVSSPYVAHDILDQLHSRGVSTEGQDLPYRARIRPRTAVAE